MLDRLISVVYPKTCVLCGQVVRATDLWCGECALPLPRGPLCPRCGMEKDCCVCRHARFAFSRAVAPFVYRGNLRLQLLDLKKRPNERLCRFLAGEMCAVLREIYPEDFFDVIVPVPAVGGRNHAEELARAVAAKTGVPLAPRALTRLPKSRVQHSLGLENRFKNAKASYEIQNGQVVAEKRVLLVDDILTTGATAHFCARSLLRAGAAQVDVLTASCTAGNTNKVKFV